MSYRNDLEALAARHAALDADVNATARQRDDAARLLADAKARAKLPVLDNIRIASPCREDWQKMTGDDKTRECAKCEKQVFNLSAMTRDEAEALIVAKHGQLCARYFQRYDGTILLADCTIGASAAKKRKWIALGAAALLAGGGAAYELGKSNDVPLMGAIAVAAPLESPNDDGTQTQQESPPPPKRPETHHMAPSVPHDDHGGFHTVGVLEVTNIKE